MLLVSLITGTNRFMQVQSVCYNDSGTKVAYDDRSTTVYYNPHNAHKQIIFLLLFCQRYLVYLFLHYQESGGEILKIIVHSPPMVRSILWLCMKQVHQHKQAHFCFAHHLVLKLKLISAWESNHIFLIVEKEVLHNTKSVGICSVQWNIIATDTLSNIDNYYSENNQKLWHLLTYTLQLILLSK